MSFEKPKSIRWLLNQTPFDGCLLLFNAPYLQVRQRAGEIGLLQVNKVSDAVISRGTYCNVRTDLYITIKGE